MRLYRGNNTKWLLFNEGEDFTVYKRSGAGWKEFLRIDKEQKTANFETEIFVLHEEETIKAQQAEQNEFVKYSAKYGTWYRELTDLEVADLEFALSVLSKLR